MTIIPANFGFFFVWKDDAKNEVFVGEPIIGWAIETGHVVEAIGIHGAMPAAFGYLSPNGAVHVPLDRTYDSLEHANRDLKAACSHEPKPPTV